MQKFRDFLKNDLLILEGIYYTDRTLFRKIVTEAAPSDEELTELDVELSDPEKAKAYLNNKEELELIKKYKADPTSIEGIEARNKVVENKLKFIHLLTHKAVARGNIKADQREDAFQNAVISLMHAIDLYDPDKNVPFTAYAKQWILAGIINPYNPKRQTSISSDLVGKDSEFGLTSIDTPITSAMSDDKELTLGDVIPDKVGENPFEKLDEKDIKARLKIYLKKLTDKEALAIRLRFSTNPDGKPHTYQEIGEKLGMTVPGARMLVEKALNKLKTFYKEETDLETA